MSDLHCPVRVHLGGPEPHPDRIAELLDRRGRSPDEVVTELAGLADEFRGEAVQLRVAPEVAQEVSRRLTGRDEVTCLEGDADGWRPLDEPDGGGGQQPWGR